MRIQVPVLLCLLVGLTGCNRGSNNDAPSGGGDPPGKQTLAEARKGFQTKPRPNTPAGPLPEPPASIFIKTRFESPVGKLSTYLTPDPKDGKKHPAIIWITGGDCNSVDGSIWQDAPPQSDETAAAYRKAGIIMMFPSLRGGNDNPGAHEWFFGEVDDVLAAADHLAKLDYVDPKRIYLGGHSTGGTLVLLTAEMSDRFRAVFSFGPASDVSFYPAELRNFDTANPREVQLRSPIHWLDSIKSPVFVFEGKFEGNIHALEQMKAKSKNNHVKFFTIDRGNHFNILAPLNAHIAQRILRDAGEKCNLEFSAAELNKLRI